MISANQHGDPDIFIVNGLGYKRLFLNPIIFSFYGHLGGYQNVVNVRPDVRDTYGTSGLFRNCETNAAQIWAVEVTGEDGGIFHRVAFSGNQAIRQDPKFFDKVFCINSSEEAWYPKSIQDYTNLNQIPIYQR